MDFTVAHQRLSSIYSEIHSEFIRREFNYNRHHCYLYYLNPDDGTDMIHLYIDDNNTAQKHYSVFCNFSFVRANDDRIYLNPFFPKKEYRALRDGLFQQDSFSPRPLFEHIRTLLEKSVVFDFVACDYGKISNQRKRATVRTTSGTIAKSYFLTIRTSNISSDMIKRIRSEYRNPDEILNFLHRNHKTLVFTDDYERRKNFYAYMEGEYDLTL